MSCAHTPREKCKLNVHTQQAKWGQHTHNKQKREKGAAGKARQALGKRVEKALVFIAHTRKKKKRKKGRKNWQKIGLLRSMRVRVENL